MHRRIRDCHVLFTLLVNAWIKHKVWGAKPDSRVGLEALEDVQCIGRRRSERNTADRHVIDFLLVVHRRRIPVTRSPVNLEGISPTWKAGSQTLMLAGQLFMHAQLRDPARTDQRLLARAALRFATPVRTDHLWRRRT